MHLCVNYASDACLAMAEGTTERIFRVRGRNRTHDPHNAGQMHSCRYFTLSENRAVETPMLAVVTLCEKESSQATWLTRSSCSSVVGASNRHYRGCGFNS